MNDTEKRTLRTDRGALIGVLREAGSKIRNNAATCPFHDDRNPSASIFQTTEGVWRFRCHTCGITEDVIGLKARLANRSSGEVLKSFGDAQPARHDREPAKPARVFPSVAAMIESVSAYATIEGHWVYGLDRAEMVVIRKREAEGRKSYLQAKPVPGGFVMQAPPKPWPIYAQRQLRDRPGDFVVVVEGEKCVHALADLGYLATTSPGGAGKAALADWTLAGGPRTVFLWPDNDPPNSPDKPNPGQRTGIAHMDDVAEILAKLLNPPRVLRIDPDKLNLPPKGDVVDFIAANPDDPAGAIAGVLATADAVGPAAKVAKLIDDTITGKRVAVDWPWFHLSKLTQALLPGTITVLCGDGGSTKTFFVLEAAAYWQGKGIPWAMQELEEDEEGATLLRVLAQIEGNGDLNQMHWMVANPDAVRDAHARRAEYLDAFGRNLWAVPGHMPTLDELTAWVRERCMEGKRVIIIDPITAADSDDKPWIADKRFIRTVQSILREYGASLILVTHPKQGRKNAVPTMDEVSGGSAYQRFTQNVFWLQGREDEDGVTYRHYEPYLGKWNEGHVDPNRVVRVFKARNGRKSRFELAFTFGPDLAFYEHGVIVKKNAGGLSLPNLSERPRITPPMGTVLKDAFGD